MALLLACRWYIEKSLQEFGYADPKPITIPKYTYVGVPMSIIHAGFNVWFDNRDWSGYYQLKPLPIFDCARWLSEDMYSADPPYREDHRYDGNMLCLSFHPTKILGISTHGGAILHDNDEADEWLRMARFDGRKQGVAPRDQTDWILGYHCYMNPVTAAEGLVRLSTLPSINEPLPNDDYADLSKLEIFQ
jgi:hypothetical protein